jgi:hypothetical protein
MAMKGRALSVLLVCLFLVSNTAGIYFASTSWRSLQVWDLPLWQAGRWIVEGRGDPYGDGIFALFIAMMLALRSGQDEWGGICMALTMAKPQMSFLLVPAFLLIALTTRPWWMQRWGAHVS